MNREIIIGKSRIERANGQARLVSDISVDGEKRSMFFGVDPGYEGCLTAGRADPFLAVMVNFALRTRRPIICEDPVSEKMLFSIRHFYMIFLEFWTDVFSQVEIRAQATDERLASQNAVGAAMSFGCDSLYTFVKHYNKTEYPITHLCNFNNGVYGDEAAFAAHSQMVSAFAQKKGLQSVSVDTNIQAVLPERFLDVYTQRNVSCVLALQGLFGTYLYASGHDEEHIKADPHNSSYYDMVSMEVFSTETLRFILSGSETTRVGKMRLLCDDLDARELLHPCFKAPIGSKNCGHCQKDIREMVLLHAWGKEKEFDAVYDWTDFEKRLPNALGILIALSKDHLYKEVLEEYVKCGKTIPEASYRYAECYKKAMEGSLISNQDASCQ